MSLKTAAVEKADIDEQSAWRLLHINLRGQWWAVGTSELVDVANADGEMNGFHFPVC